VSAFIDENRARLGVEPICRELEVSASAYRARRSKPPSERALRDAFLLAQIRRVHTESQGIYGQLKVWDEFNETGVRVARCTIERLMHSYGIAGIGPARTAKTTLPGSAPVAAPDLVRRNFTATAPNQLWLADIERHEALSNRAVMKGHRLWPVAAGR
jgi:putative transposase